MNFWIRLGQVFLFLIPIGIFCFLLRQELVPSGVFKVSSTVGESSPFIDRLLPDQRVFPAAVDQDGDMTQTIISDPVFFFAHPHRGFDQVEAEVWFKNSGVPIVELGGFVREPGQVYDLKPLQNFLLDNLFWLKLEQDGLTLWQRQPVYKNLDEFLRAAPANERVAAYNFSLARDFVLSGYAPSATWRDFPVSLRGFHEWKVYVQNETLSVKANFQDNNPESGVRDVSLLVYDSSGNLVVQKQSAAAAKKTELFLTVPNLSTGG